MARRLRAIIFARGRVGGGQRAVLFGRNLSLNPVAIFASLLFWGWLWGAAGVLMLNRRTTPCAAASDREHCPRHRRRDAGAPA